MTESAQTSDKTFRCVSEKTIWSGHVFSLNTLHIDGPSGEQFERSVVRHPGAVIVVPVEDGCALLVRQYRASIDDYLLELPAGKRDVAEEDPVKTAHRELEEEVGRRCGQLTLLAEFYNSPGFTDEYSYCYLAQSLSAGTSSPQGVEEENLSVVKVELSKVNKMIETKELIDAKSIIGLMLAKARLGL